MSGIARKNRRMKCGGYIQIGITVDGSELIPAVPGIVATAGFVAAPTPIIAVVPGIPVVIRMPGIPIVVVPTVVPVVVSVPA
jgi:hypothetical protein